MKNRILGTASPIEVSAIGLGCMAMSHGYGEPADNKGVTPAQVAISWILYQKPWIVPIPDSRSLKHLENNIAAANVNYTPEEMA